MNRFELFMKTKFRKIILILPVFFIVSAFSLHKFYVSVTEINYNEQEKKLEIILRTFPDDVMNALNYNQESEIVSLSGEQAQKRLNVYIENTFHITVNGKNIDYQILGGKMQDEFYVVLMEVNLKETIKKISIRNIMLQEIYKDQQNIVHFFRGEQKRSFVLTKQKSSVDIEL